MEVLAAYWFLFPISIVIATIAMCSGIGGVVFFSPLFIIVLGLDPLTAIGAGLVTELFGFSSGSYGYALRKLIDYKHTTLLMFFSIPSALIGVCLTPYIPSSILLTLFSIMIIFVGIQLYVGYLRAEKENHLITLPSVKHQKHLTARNGEVYTYTLLKRKLACLLALVGGLFFGLVSVGLSELQEYHLLVKNRVPTPVAVGSSIFLVAVTAIFVVITKGIIAFIQADYSTLIMISQIVLFTAPGVLIGGQIGPILQQRINQRTMNLMIGTTLILVGFTLVLPF